MPRNAATNRFKLKEIPSSLSFNNSTTTVAYSGAGVTGFASACSFSGWVYIASGSTTQRIVVARWGTGGSDRCALCFNQVTLGKEDYKLESGYYNGTTYTRSLSGFAPVNKWFHVAYTWDGVTSLAYINGTLLSASSGNPASSPTTGLSLGNQTGAFWKGYQSNVKLYTRVLTQDEITALSLMQDDQVSTTGLWVDWRMDEGAGGSVTDYSGNSRTGTITSGTFVYDSPMKARKQINGSMVKNGDFEYAPPFTAATTTSARWIDGTASGSSTNDLFRWYHIVGVANYASSFDTTTKRSGTASLKIEATDTSGRGRALSAPFEATTTESLVRQYGIPCLATSDYDLSCYIKTNNCQSNSIRLQIQYFNGSGTSLGTTNGTYQVGTQDWTAYSLRFTTLSATQYFIVKFTMDVAGSICQAWLDDLSITPVYPEGRVPANGNLVKNFDFEVYPTLVAPQTTAGTWIVGTSAGSSTNATYKWAIPSAAISAAASVRFDTTVSHNGNASIKLDVTDASGTVVVSNILNSAVGGTLGSINVLPNTSYSFSAWVKTSTVGTNGVYMDVRQFNAAGSTITTTSSNKLSGTNDWTQVTGSFTSNAAATNVCIILRNGVAGQASTAWFDDIYLAPTTNPGRVVIT